MKQSTTFLCLSGLAGSAFAFAPPSAVPRTGNAWTSRASTSSPVPAESGRLGSPLCMTTQPMPEETIEGVLRKRGMLSDEDEEWQWEVGVPDTPMTRKFGHLREAKVKTVSETVADFYKHYKKVVISNFRTMVTEYLQSTHLIVYDARFKYDPFFGAGLYLSFMRFLRTYPKEGEAELIFEGLVKALGQGLDPERMRQDAAAIKAWGEGKTEDDVIAAMKGEGDSNVVTDGFYIARTGLGPFGEGWEEKGEDVDWFVYNRMWAVGMFTVIESIGVEPTEELLEKWFGILKIDPYPLTKDFNTYQEQISKVEQAEQLFKEIEIREKKRLAERLESKAQDAIRLAERAEKDAQFEKEEQERIANAKEGDVLANNLSKD